MLVVQQTHRFAAMALCGLAAFWNKLRRSAWEHSLNSRCATAASRGRCLPFYETVWTCKRPLRSWPRVDTFVLGSLWRRWILSIKRKKQRTGHSSCLQCRKNYWVRLSNKFKEQHTPSVCYDGSTAGFAAFYIKLPRRDPFGPPLPEASGLRTFTKFDPDSYRGATACPALAGAASRARLAVMVSQLFLDSNPDIESSS